MIQFVFSILTATFLIPPAGAQPNPGARFARYCDQLAAAVPAQAIDANVKVGSLWAVVDATNGTDRSMREAVTRGLDYQQFKSEMALKKIVLNDQVHSAHYALAARAKCEVTESGAGDVSSQAHNSPTDEQTMRRVNDSGIGVTNDSDTGTRPSETEK